MGILQKIKDTMEGGKIDYTEIAQILPKGEFCFKVHTKNGKYFYKNCKLNDAYYVTFIKYVKEEDKK